MPLQFKPWTLVSVFSLVISVLAIGFNSFVLVIFARNANLRTPFTIYIINLFVANLVNQMYQQPLAIVTHLYSSKYLGRAFCNASLYGSFTLHSAVYSAHFAITLNRIWAVASPLTYRRFHTKPFAATSCPTVWIYVHVVMLPGLIMNSLYYERPLELGCYIAKQPLRTWSIVEQSILYDIPLSILILAYPVICFTEVRRRVRRSRLVQLVSAKRGNNSSVQMAPLSRPSLQIAVDNTGSTPPGVGRHNSNAFIVLTILTVSNCVFLMPLTVAYNLSTAFLAGESPRWQARWSLDQLYVVAPMLFYAQAVLDPLLFTLALKDLRSTACTTLNGVLLFFKTKF